MTDEYQIDATTWAEKDANGNIKLTPDISNTDDGTVNQKQTWGRTSVSSDTTTDGTSVYWHVDTDAAGNDVTLTLASSDAVEGREVNVKRDGANDVTIDTEGTETIDGEASITLGQDQEAVTLVYNSADSDWELW